MLVCVREMFVADVHHCVGTIPNRHGCAALPFVSSRLTALFRYAEDRVCGEIVAVLGTHQEEYRSGPKVASAYANMTSLAKRITTKPGPVQQPSSSPWDEGCFTPEPSMQTGKPPTHDRSLAGDLFDDFKIDELRRAFEDFRHGRPHRLQPFLPPGILLPGAGLLFSLEDHHHIELARVLLVAHHQ